MKYSVVQTRNVLPKFNLICLDSASSIHTGDLSTGYGSVVSFTKI